MTIITALVLIAFESAAYDFAVESWRKIHLDICRDELFSLRDELRQYFFDNNLDMNSRIYKNTRDLLNAHLRFTDGFSFKRIAFYSKSLESNPELSKTLEKDFELRFYTKDKELAKFISYIRYESVLSLKNYAINRSYKLWVLSRVFKLAGYLRLNYGALFAKNPISRINDNDKIEEASFQNAIINNMIYSTT